MRNLIRLKITKVQLRPGRGLVEVLVQVLVKPQVKDIKVKKQDLVFQSKALKVAKCQFTDGYQKEVLLTQIGLAFLS